MNASEFLAKTDFKQWSFYGLCAVWIALGFSKALTEIAFVATFWFWVFWKVTRHQGFSNEFPLKILVPLLGFTLLSVLSIFWSDVPKASFRGMFKVLEQVTLFFMVSDIFQTREDLKKFQRYFLIGYLIVVFDSFWQFAFGKDLLRGFELSASHAGPRVTGPLAYYGVLACYLMMTIPVILGAGMRHKHGPIWNKAGIALAAAGGLILLFLTRSRGAYVAFFLGLMLFLLGNRKWIWILLLVGISYLGVQFLPHTMVWHLDAERKEQSLVERYRLWERALHVIQAKPLTGTGINTYTKVHENYDKTKNWRVRSYYAHNGYLQMAAETGLPSLALFLTFLFFYFILSLQHQASLGSGSDRMMISGMLLGIVNFLIFAGVDTVMHNPQPVMIFWFFLGLQWACQKALPRE